MNARNVNVRRIIRSAGNGGLVSYHVEVGIDETATRRFTFDGNIFLGPVHVQSFDDDGQQRDEVVHEPRRFGEFFSEDWIHAFFADCGDVAV